MPTSETVIAYLIDETYTYVYSGDESFSTIKKGLLSSQVRGMIDDYYRVYASIKQVPSISTKALYVNRYVELGYDRSESSAFVTALISAKTKNIGFNFTPGTKEAQTGKGEVSYTNKVIDWGSDTIKTASEVPGAFLETYKFVPLIALAFGAWYVFTKLPKNKK